MFSSDRNTLRQVFYDAWQKHQERRPLELLEAQLLDIMLAHPEYHAVLDHPEQFKAEDFQEGNPFLHMSLHLAIREQINTNRPAGIASVYQTLSQQSGDALMAEHKMMECLGQFLWEAQQNQAMPDEQVYLEALRKL